MPSSPGLTWLDRAIQYSRAIASERHRRNVLNHPLSRMMTPVFAAYVFSVSRNRTGSPVDGVVNSPCHITRRPRTKVPTGQPVTRMPS